MKASGSAPVVLEPRQNHLQALCDYSFDAPMHLPQLFSPESAIGQSCFISPAHLNTMDIECSQNLLRLTAGGCGLMQQETRFNGDWSFLDKLLASHQSGGLDHQHPHSKCNPSSQVTDHMGTSTEKFPFHYLGCDTDILKFSK